MKVCVSPAGWWDGHRVVLCRNVLAVCLLGSVGRVEASILLRIYPSSPSSADIVVEGTDNSTTGSFDPNTPGQRAARMSLLNQSNGYLGNLFSTEGSTAAWTYGGTSTLATSGGSVLATAYASVGPFTGGQDKIVISLSFNTVAGWTITGRIDDLTLPVGFTWGPDGQTGALYYGQNNGGNAITRTGTWEIVSPPPPPRLRWTGAILFVK